MDHWFRFCLGLYQDKSARMLGNRVNNPIESHVNVRHLRRRIESIAKIIFAICLLVSFIIMYHSSVTRWRNIHISNLPAWPMNKGGELSPITKGVFRTTHQYPRDKARAPLACWIIVRNSVGRLGNRMFLFASAYGLARLHQCHLYIAPWILNDLRSVFVVNITRTPVNVLENSTDFENRTDVFKRSTACTLFDDLLRVPLQTKFIRYELEGFYQAYGYFDRYREEIAQLFEFNREIIKSVKPIVEQLVKTVWNTSVDFASRDTDNITFSELKFALRSPAASHPSITWVGVHIRRGDFLTFFRIDTSISYLLWAIGYYRRKYINCRFLIASDDKVYAKKYLGHLFDVIIISSSLNYGGDLAALTLCEHSILTAGTYGWWIAWLTGGNVVHDLNYPVPFQNCIREHYFPPWFLFPQNSSSKRYNKK